MSAKRKTTSGRKRVEFSTEAPVGAEVFVAGSFNDWDASAKRMKDKQGNGTYRAICMLEPGAHEYKFVVDGEWTVDPQNPNFVVNDMGTLNSVVEVT